MLDFWDLASRSTEDFHLQFQGDTPSALGSSFDELMRHVNSLREDTVEMVLTIFRTLCKLGGQAEGTSSQQEVRDGFLNFMSLPADCFFSPVDRPHVLLPMHYAYEHISGCASAGGWTLCKRSANGHG